MIVRDGHRVHRGAVGIQDVLWGQVREEIRPNRPICRACEDRRLKKRLKDTVHTLRTRYEPLVVEADAKHAVLVVADDLDWLVLGEIPHDDASIAARAREDAAVNAYTQHAALVHPLEHTHDRARGEVPFADCAVLGTREEHLSARLGVRVQLQAVNGVRVGIGRAARLQVGERVRACGEAVAEADVGLVEVLVVGL